MTESPESSSGNQIAPILRARGMVKYFSGVTALSGVDLTLKRGEILAVVGENGAGKSTLMKILAGILSSDKGVLEIDGKPVLLRGVEDAHALGVSLIHQELNLAGNLDVASNLFLGREIHRFGWLNRSAMHSSARTHLDAVGFTLPTTTLVEELSLGQKQMVEIAKALAAEARILIMDEPTSSLTLSETRRLTALVEDLRERGVSVIYITHRLGEVEQLADRVMVLRDGALAGELEGKEISRDGMVALMVGRKLEGLYHHERKEPGDLVLAVEGLRTAAHPAHPLSFSVHGGEVVGLGGLVGAGRTEVLQSLFAMPPPAGGSIDLEGEALSCRTPQEAVAVGIGFVPEDRTIQGLVGALSVADNLNLTCLERDARRGFVDRPKGRRLAEALTRDLDIQTPSSNQRVSRLSGGNQQKVVLGKWLARKPRLLLLDEPTRGVDVGAKAEIYAIVDGLAREGVAILFVSSEMEELIGLADRILVMHEGRLRGELAPPEITEEAIMDLATGGVGAEVVA